MTQKEALDLMKMGGNIFLTGPAGSGKTFVLNEYIDYLKKHKVSVAVTASTGIASTHLNGTTIHSFSGLGIRDTLTDYDIETLLEKEYLHKKISRTKVLIIDEVSMLSSKQLDMVEWIVRSFKGNDKVFGGMQVIFCGDFFQLPPISRGEDVQNNFAYTSEVWDSLNINICYLSENHRHKGGEYLDFLNKIRQNKITEKDKQFISSKIIKEGFNKSNITKLFTHNADVDRINKAELSKINKEVKVFKMTSKGKDFLVENLKKSCLAPETLELKVGAKVMFVKNNYEAGFVNGTLGEVSGFNSFGEPIVKTLSGKIISVSLSEWRIEEEGKIKASISQFPLRLAWAITVHKSQGMSLDEVALDLSMSFVKGQGYVALSRVRSVEGLYILGFNEKALEVDDSVLEMDIEFQDMSDRALKFLNSLDKKEKERIQNNFLNSIREDKNVEEKETTQEKTLNLIKEKKSLDEISKERNLKKETIISHIEDLISEGNSIDLGFLKKEFKYGELDEIIKAFEKTGDTALSPVYNYLLKKNKKPNYLKIRIARLFI